MFKYFLCVGEPPRNELPISAIDAFEDEVDEEFLHNPRQTILIRDIPVGLEVEPADIVPSADAFLNEHIVNN